MSARRRSGRLMAAPRVTRRSLRLEKVNFQEYKGFPAPDVATPRTLFRKVLQTQPIASPLVPEKADSPKPVETTFQIPSRNAADSNLEISLSDPVPKETLRPALLRNGKKKKVRLSEFERGLAKQLPSTTAKSFLDNTSLTGSLQVSLGTPVSPPPDGKRGLIRRPKSYKGVNVMTFEGGMEQNLQQIKGAQNHYVGLHVSDRSNATDTMQADTELFAQSQLSSQNRPGLPVPPSQPASARKSLPQENTLSSAADLQIPQQGADSDMDVGVAWQDQKDISMPSFECADGTEDVPEGRTESPREDEHEREQAIERGMVSTPTTRDAPEMDAVPQQSSLSPEREQQESLNGNHLTEREESLHSNNLVELHLSPEEPLSSGISTPKPSSLVDDKLSAVPTGSLRAFVQEKPTKRSVKAIVAHIIEELDRNMAPHVVDQGVSGADLEKEPSPSKEAAQISQRTRTGSLTRSVSGRDAELLEREALEDGAIQQSGSKPREVSVLESEAAVVSEIEMEPEVEDISEAEMDSEDNEPPVKTPAFVRLKAFQCSPLLSSPYTLKVAASKSASEQPSKKQIPKESKKARRAKREPGLSSNWVKKIFSHYARMPVAKDAFQAVEKCVNLYFKHLSDDLEAYTNHARRKTIESADLELLMRRQGLITDKMPLNVLIERHLPLEYRKLLIPVATSGNKVIPLNAR
ncbi:centromere protein T [Eublepharis macularius]|uniref:Centromere protein T n=1 Tax=Eublepharis macularius TaxID=481883 RepID=A0AA97KGZ3_EUBMA|nr:centromere protein T [Eublepharis macularius]